MPELWELRQMQSLPLTAKVRMTENRIREWVTEYGEDGVYVSFSGGKDSTVLLDIVRRMYPGVKAVFVNTGHEYPEIQQLVKTFDNVTILRPKMRFDEVIKKFGYPIISKRIGDMVYYARKNVRDGNMTSQRVRLLLGDERMQNGNRSKFAAQKYAPLIYTDFETSAYCCDVMKKNPLKEYQKSTGKHYPIVATMASESMEREQRWIKLGCNAFNSSSPMSTPMAFWTEQDVLQYIKENNLPIASVYGDIVSRDNDGNEYSNELVSGGKLYTTGCERTGCIFCAFGCHLEKGESRFQRLKRTHPRQYEYCIGGGAYDDDGIWKPNKEGLGMGHVFDELNKIYGEGFIKY